MAGVWVDKPITRASRNDRARSRCRGMWCFQFTPCYLGNYAFTQFLDVLVRTIKNEIHHDWDVGWMYEMTAAFRSGKLARRVWNPSTARASEGSQ